MAEKTVSKNNKELWGRCFENQLAFCSKRNLSAIRAINSEFVGFPL